LEHREFLGILKIHKIHILDLRSTFYDRLTVHLIPIVVGIWVGFSSGGERGGSCGVHTAAGQRRANIVQVERNGRAGYETVVYVDVVTWGRNGGL